jgi:hypothetical protein
MLPELYAKAMLLNSLPMTMRHLLKVLALKKQLIRLQQSLP